MLWVGEEKVFSLQISGSPLQVPPGTRPEADHQSGMGCGQDAIAFCGAGSVGDIHSSGFLSQQKAELLST